MKIKLHIVPFSHPKVRYQHEMVSLAEGLRSLGVDYFGTDDYWMEPDRGKYLISRSPLQYNSDVNVYNTCYFNAFPEAIEAVDYSNINVLIDREDGLYGEYCNPRYKKFNLILRTHYNGNINYQYYHPNIRPWAFALSNRIIQVLDRERNVTVEERAFISFRLSHDLRSKAVEQFSPVISKKYAVFDKITNVLSVASPESFSNSDKLLWEQSGHRHDPSYYKLLNSSLLTFAFGGFIYPRPFATNRMNRQFQKVYRAKSAVLKMMGKDDSDCYFIDQFDSWRLWESFYSNSCPVHMDFTDWNWILPVMPESKVHYWGVKKFDFERSALELTTLHKDDILQIGQNGREWSMLHYSPVAIAERFLKLISNV